MRTDDPAALIVTAELDAEAQALLDRLRRAHFPPSLNHLAAHLTLFHALPGLEIAAVLERLRMAASATPVLPLLVTGPRPLGRGVALTVAGAGLVGLRAGLARDFSSWLTAQDGQGFRPHVTVQNKVDPAAARALLDELRAGWRPLPALATGLRLWRYRGGPWDSVAELPFTGAG